MRGLRKLLFGNTEKSTSDAEPSIPDSSSETRRLQLELAEQGEELSILQKDVQRLRESQQRMISDSVESNLDRLFSEVAAPLCQLLTQMHLVEDQGKSVESKDTMRLVKRLFHVFKETGLDIDGPVGEQMPFDPNHHEPLSTDHYISTGDKVVVRTPGLAFSGRVIRKAGVAPAKE